MEIKTKFEPQQKVFALYCGCIYKVSITSIEIEKINNELLIFYRYFIPGKNQPECSHGDELFATKEEAEEKLNPPKKIDNDNEKRLKT